MRIGFLGDTNFSGCYMELSEPPVCTEIIEIFREHNFLVANLEGPFLSVEQIGINSRKVASPQNSVKWLKALNINILNLANNHTMDAGTGGLHSTLAQAIIHGLYTFGAGINSLEVASPLILEHDEVRVALVGITMHEGQLVSRNGAGVFGEGQIDLIKETLVIAREMAQYTVLCHHGGVEYTFYPSPHRRRFYHELSHMEVDAIIGCHPHTVQGYEMIGDVPVLYSLGNFIFDYPSHKYFPGTKDSLLLTLDFANDHITFEVMPMRQKISQRLVVPGTLPNQYQDLAQLDFRHVWCLDACRVAKTRLQVQGRFPGFIGKILRVIRMMMARNLRPLLLCYMRGWIR